MISIASSITAARASDGGGFISASVSASATAVRRIRAELSESLILVLAIRYPSLRVTRNQHTWTMGAARKLRSDLVPTFPPTLRLHGRCNQAVQRPPKYGQTPIVLG